MTAFDGSILMNFTKMDQSTALRTFRLRKVGLRHDNQSVYLWAPYASTG